MRILNKISLLNNSEINTTYACKWMDQKAFIKVCKTIFINIRDLHGTSAPYNLQISTTLVNYCVINVWTDRQTDR